MRAPLNIRKTNIRRLAVSHFIMILKMIDHFEYTFGYSKMPNGSTKSFESDSLLLTQDALIWYLKSDTRWAGALSEDLTHARPANATARLRRCPRVASPPRGLVTRKGWPAAVPGFFPWKFARIGQEEHPFSLTTANDWYRHSTSVNIFIRIYYYTDFYLSFSEAY